MCAIGRCDQLCCMPLGTIVVSPTTPCAIATRDQLGKVLVTTATCLPHGARIASLVHMLHCVHTKKPSIARGKVAMKVVISILQLQKWQAGLGTTPTNSRTKNWIVLTILAVPSLLHQAPPAAAWVECTLLSLAATHLQMARQVCVPEVCALVIWH